MPPKRKATSKLSGLVDSDSDNAGASHHDPVEERPAKKARGRPKSSGAKIEEQSTTAARGRRSSSAGTVKQDVTAKKVSRRKLPPAATTEQESAVEDDVEDDVEQRQAIGDGPLDTAHERIYASEELSQSTKRGRGRKAASTAKQVTEDGEFEYTPTGSRQLKPTEAPLNLPTKRRSICTLGREPEELVIPDSPAPASAADDAIPAEVYTTVTAVSPHKSLTNGLPERVRKRPTVTFADEKTPSDPDLRRKLGDMTKKYETLESKYRTLREIGIVEANNNVEKIKKQCETVTNASNKLIASLKEELAAQTALGKESRDLLKQLRDREKDSSNLQSQVDELSAQLSTAQTEIKTLQTKLAAARNNAVSAKTLNVEAPGSAVKNLSGRNAAVVSNAQAVQAAQIAQLKEDLYGDLTGLIIRGVQERDADHLYDCIQTGANGTLQFKLAVAHAGGSKTTASLDTAEFRYLPLLDAKRDAALINLLPEYLTVDIKFSRQNASKFYTRVMDSLTKRRIDPEE